MTVNGKPIQVSGPHLPLEHIGRYIHLPDQRVVRRLTTKFNFLTAKGTDIPILTRRIRAGTEATQDVNVIGLPRIPIAAADFIMSEYLKPAWLMRLAWPIRVIGEEQLRMAGAGLDSVVKHPISYISTVIGGDQTRMVRMLDKMTPGTAAKMTISPNGALFEETEELKSITYRAHAAWLGNEATVRTNIPTIYTRHNLHELADYRSSWAHELALLHHDPVSNFVANSTMDEAVEWLYRGPGNKYRRELMEAHPGNLESRVQVEEYIKTVTDRISFATANHPDLIDVVKSGKFSKFKDGKETISDVFHDAPRINPQFSNHLRDYTDIGPDKIKGTVGFRAKDRGEFTSQYDAALDRIFSALMGTPTSTLSRAPAFKQFVWKRAAELLPYADNEARDIILANARKAGLNKRQMKNLERAALRGKVDDATGEFAGVLNADDIDLLAKGHAVEDTKTLLYDLSERSQIFDIMRILVPFGEAWKEVLTRWAKLATIQGPMGIPLPGKAVRRAQQTIQGARGTGFGATMGAGTDPITGKDRGFFFKNEFGEEVFVWPGSQFLTSALAGVPIPLTGRVQGLNMFGNILPGLGPVAQIPAAWFLQNKPQYEFWREQLIPFGAPGANETEDIFSAREYLPAWGKSVVDWLANGGDDRIYNSSVMYTAAYLQSTGEYGDSAEEQQRLMEDADDAADDLYLVRGLGQFLLPASPSFSWVTETDKGLINTRMLAEKFYALQEEDYDTAIDKYLDMYGPNAIGAIVPHSRNVISAVPVSIEGATWVVNNADVKKKYPLVYGFFAPEGEFNMGVYARNYITGEREAITPREWRNMLDTMMGNYHYNRAKDMLGDDKGSPNREQAAWLRTQHDNVLEAYPNWDNRVGLAERPQIDQMVRQLYEASSDPAIAKTNAGKGLLAYMKLRDAAQAQVDKDRAAGETEALTFKSANDYTSLRQWLSDNANRIIGVYPEFEKTWDLVFSRELEDPVEEGKK
jgi:hypothetical protein